MTEIPQLINNIGIVNKSDMSLPVVAIHRADQKNVGDLNSRPDLYFKWINPNKIVDIEDPNFSNIVKEFSNSAVIVGGGGLIFDGKYTQVYRDNFDILYGSRRKSLIAWGIGHNNHDGGNILLPNLNMYNLIGIRDYLPDEFQKRGSKYLWVPCASSLHPIFDAQYPIKHDVVFFQHKFHPSSEVTIKSGIPTMDNSGKNIEEVIRFISSGETVLTSSYHGVYWGILLGRKVVVIDPFSTKFKGFKWEVPSATGNDWKEVIPRAKRYPEALQESREANNNFAALVKERLGIN